MTYGNVPQNRQGGIIANLLLGHNEAPSHATELAKAIVREMQANQYKC